MPKFCAMNTSDGFLDKPYAPSMQLAIDNGLEESLRREDGSNTVSSQKIVQEAQSYKEKAGINKRTPDKYQQLDENFAKQVAKAYEEMRHNPSDPETANAYQALITETLAQYEEIIANGLQVEFIPNGTLSPYEIPSQAVEDIVTNNHMWVYSTRDGHGQGESLADNPLLQETQHKISGQTALANDIFRVVHDYYGHAKNGIGFRAEGEENAFLSHSAMYTNPAQRALATETRGQNSWVNFGPYGAQNKNASESDTIFAPQKVGLLPEELSNPSYPYASDADAISETVEDMKNGSAFGETFNIDGSRYTGGGIGVAVISVNVNTKNLTPAMIRGKIKKFLKENRLSEKIGVFTLDDTDGKISSIDLTLIFPQEQKNLAIQLGSFTRQQSLWDFDNSELVYTGRNDTGLDHKNLTPTQLSAVRDAMARGELPSFVQPKLSKSREDASDIFGEGAERVKYTDPKSGSRIEVIVYANGFASVIELYVPEKFRGKGIGKQLQRQVMSDFPNMGGQVSSKAAAKTAYDLGRRPPENPNATLSDVFKMIDSDSSVNLISKSTG